MAYVVERNVPTLGLKVGDKLKHEQGQLPAALTFDAVWYDEVEAVKPEKKVK